MTIYDVRLKSLLRTGARVFFDHLEIAGGLDAMDTDMSRVHGRRVDFLARSIDGGVVHIELQSSADASVPIRMLEYYVDIVRSEGGHRRIDYQVLIESLKIRQTAVFLRGLPSARPKLHERSSLAFVYKQKSILEFPGAAMRQSSDLGDVVLSYLTEGGDERPSVAETLSNIAKLCKNGTIGQEDRDFGIATLVVFSSLRNGAGIVNSELSQMEIDIDLAANEVILEFAEARERRNLIREIEEGVAESQGESTWSAAIESELLACSLKALRKILRKIDQHPIGALLASPANDGTQLDFP